MKTGLFSIVLLSIIWSCSSDKKEKEPALSVIPATDIQTQLAYCHTCHNSEAASHDDILAPPLAAVKMRYKMSYPEKQDFVDALSKWAMNPTEESGLMRGAISQYGVMPKAPFSESDLRDLAEYIYDTDLPEPAWFKEHERQMHGRNGMGRGMGNAGN